MQKVLLTANMLAQFGQSTASVLLASLLLLSSGFVAVSDLAADVEFPPIRPPRPPGAPLPVGHQMPLGWQKDSDGPIIEYTKVRIPALQFSDRSVQHSGGMHMDGRETIHLTSTNDYGQHKLTTSQCAIV